MGLGRAETRTKSNTANRGRKPVKGEELRLPDPTRDHIQGEPDAPIVLLEYGDFACPACGAVYAVLKALAEQLGERICLAFRDFPLTTLHPHAEQAAEAAEAAGAQGRFWEMHDMLFENQNALDEASLLEYATVLNLDAYRLFREVLDKTHHWRIREDFRAGIGAGVYGTPTVFINGKRYDGPPDFESMLTVLESAIVT